ncbi:MAG: AAA family ATPase [Fibrobacter sp.]|nr:AAA family ATPase [Fibrobacter sp.]
MIRELRVRNLALIDELTLELNSGFSVFTGETGAGKSVLTGAIGLLLGERASAEMIRNGYDEAWVSGIFDIEKIKLPLEKLLDELSIEPEDGQLIIRRKISRNGRNQIHVNMVPLTLNALKKLGDLLIDLHGQHEHQSLLDPDNHQLIIDTLPEVSPVKQEYDKCYQNLLEATRALETHQKRARELSEKKDILQFQLDELTKLNLRSGEEQELEAELALLSSSTQRAECISEIFEALNTSVNKKISFIRKKLDTLSRYDSSVNSWINDIESAETVFSELETYCSTYSQDLGEKANPARLEFINSRISKIQRTKKKYFCNVEQLIEKQQTLKQELESLENVESDKSVLQKR